MAVRHRRAMSYPFRYTHSRMSRILAALVLLATFLGEASPASDDPDGSERQREMSEGELREQIRFGAEMAQKGNWREAMFRWQRALQQQPTNSRLHNNLAVAYETLGDYAHAEEEYKLALKRDPDLKEVRENYALFHNFYDRYRGNQNRPGSLQVSSAPEVKATTPSPPPQPEGPPR